MNQAGDVRADGQQLSYDWDAGLSEWWKNDTRGLEHGFTVHERPQRVNQDENGPLVLDMALRGDLRPSVMASGRGLQLAGAEGAVVLTYDGLVAFDADGTQLETWLEVTDMGMRIAVLEEGARYPLTVDPVMQTAYVKASNSDEGDLFGVSIAVSGDTVVIGASGEDSNATGVNGDQSDNSANRAGAAYIFDLSGLVTLGSDICDGELNSIGLGSVLAITGSIAAADNALVLGVRDLPLNTMGFFVHSAEEIFVANPGGSMGNLCIASFDIGRFAGNILNSGATGTVSLAPDLTALPGPNGPFAVLAGETRNFQYWHRDTDLGGGSTSNFSSAVSVTFE